MILKTKYRAGCTRESWRTWSTAAMAKTRSWGFARSAKRFSWGLSNLKSCAQSPQILLMLTDRLTWITARTKISTRGTLQHSWEDMECHGRRFFGKCGPACKPFAAFSAISTSSGHSCFTVIIIRKSPGLHINQTTAGKSHFYKG